MIHLHPMPICVLNVCDSLASFQVGGSLGLWLGLGVLQILALIQPMVKTFELCVKGIKDLKG